MYYSVATAVVVVTSLFFTSLAQAYDRYEYTLSVSLATTHFNPQPEHNNTQRFKGIERWGDNFVSQPLSERFSMLESAEPLVGLAHFQNSFHQSTLYAYAGYRYNVYQYQQLQLYSKITFGFIHGYRGEYQDKIPFNNLGTAPAAIPSVGLQYKRGHGELIFFGASGLMINIGLSF